MKEEKRKRRRGPTFGDPKKTMDGQGSGGKEGGGGEERDLISRI